jgi:hypothetical protein
MNRRRKNFRSRKSLLALEALEDRTVPSFAAPAVFDVGAAPTAVAVGHFEGPGSPLDVATANVNGTVSVLLGNGDGTLMNPITVNVGGKPVALAIGDFRNNGLDDIVEANANGFVSVLLSNGNGTFAKSPWLGVGGASPVGVAVTDTRDDGILDIVTANKGGTVSVLLGNSDGTFQSPIVTKIGGRFLSVADADFNHDGKPDLVVGTTTGLDTLLGKGDGTFTLKQTVSFARKIDGCTFQGSATSVATADFRGNGTEDIAALDSNSGLVVLLGNGDGTVKALSVVEGSVFGAFTVGDFVGNGHLGLASSDPSSLSTGTPGVVVLAGNGDGTFHAATGINVGESANAMAAGDFRANGKLDLVMASNAGSTSVTILVGNGDGTFVTAPTAQFNGFGYALAAGNFVSGGKPDLVVGAFDSVNVLLNNGDGTFRSGPVFQTNGVASAVVVGDFTGNGKQDIAAAMGQFIDVFLGNGDGTFQAPKVINLGINDTVMSLAAGKFRNNGRQDLAATIWLSQGSVASEIMVLLSNGDGTFKRGQTFNAGTEAQGLTTADFTGDGKTDLATTTMRPDGTRQVNVYLGNGNGTFHAPIVTSPGLSASFIAAGDFLGNGKPGLVLVDYFDVDESVLVLEGNGNGTFQKPQIFKFHNPLNYATPVIGDFFGDGKLSFAVASSFGDVSVFRGNGDGSFQAPINYLIDYIGTQPDALVAADFTGSGKLDIAAVSTLANDVSVLINDSQPPSNAAPIATKTSFSANPNPSVFGQPVTLTATVTAATGTPTGSIMFLDGTTLLGEVALDPNGQARLIVTLAPGTHALKATFVGIAPFKGSQSAVKNDTVNKDATTTTLAAEQLGTGGPELLDATVLPAAPGGGAPAGFVTFFDGNTVLGTVQVQGGTASLYLAGRLGSGTHTLTASYSGDDDFDASVSAPLVITI